MGRPLQWAIYSFLIAATLRLLLLLAVPGLGIASLLTAYSAVLLAMAAMVHCFYLRICVESGIGW